MCIRYNLCRTIFLYVLQCLFNCNLSLPAQPTLVQTVCDNVYIYVHKSITVLAPDVHWSWRQHAAVDGLRVLRWTSCSTSSSPVTKVRLLSPKSSRQCDQIGLFLKDIDCNFSCQNLVTFRVSLKHGTFNVKNCGDCIFGNFWNNRAHFYSKIWSHWLCPKLYKIEHHTLCFRSLLNKEPSLTFLLFIFVAFKVTKMWKISFKSLEPGFELMTSLSLISSHNR